MVKSGGPDDEKQASQAFYKSLDPSVIIDAADRLGFLCDGRLLALNSYENRVYRINLEHADPVVAKFYRPNRWSDEAILEEHRFSQELADDEIPVVPPVQHQNRTLHEHQGFRYAIYPCYGGRAPELDDFDGLEQLGRLVARIHQRGAQADFQYRPVIDLDSFGIESAEFLLDRAYIPNHLEAAYTSLCEDLFAQIEDAFDGIADLRWLRIHGDFHPGNVLVRGEQFHIVDLDDARSGPAIQDLWMFLSGDRSEQTPQLESLLDGYCEFREFDPRELQLIEPLRTLRLIHYAAWLGRRWEDPAFHIAFPWFNTDRYWEDHVLSLREQAALLTEPPLIWR